MLSVRVNHLVVYYVYKIAFVLTFSLLLQGPVNATTVLVFISQKEIVIAADSLSNRIEGGQRMVCKIAQVSDHMFFLATGIGATENPHFDPYDIARWSAAHRSPREAAVKYGTDALVPLQDVWRLNRSRYLEKAGVNGPKLGPQSFLFVGVTDDGIVSMVGANFLEDQSNLHNLRLSDFNEVSAENAGDFFLYKMGVYDQIPSDDQINKWIFSIGTPQALIRAIKAQVRATPNLVGGDISAVRLGGDGQIRWFGRGSCH
jgi:hypothetical protein